MESFLILIRILFFALFLGLVYVVQRFWFVRAWKWIGTLTNPHWRNGLHVVLIALAGALAAAILDPLLARAISRFSFGRPLIMTSSLWLTTSFVAFVAIQAVRGIEWVTNAIAGPRREEAVAEFNPSRRIFFKYATVVAGSAPFLAAGYGFASGRLRYTVERVEAPIANLPPQLDGLRIAQLSDIHIGLYMPPDEIARAVGMANDLQPDLAVVTGDFVNGEGDPLDACITELSRLKAPLGVWGCNGNHEIYAGVEDEAERLFREKGMSMLRARNSLIEHNGASFNLIGVDYQRDHMVEGARRGPMLQEIEQLVRRDMPNILLSHNPNSFRRAAQMGIELSLAGHTHGGQVKFEIVDHTISPARLITPFVAGLYHLPMADGIAGSAGTSEGARRSPEAALYVNRGLGTLGFPVRLGVPPEITLLTLRKT